ncbi:MAG: peptide deformylase [Candidatus Taylorbacteria bacterium RIFOXYD2_FULL_36_9]|uniref:Peptide deformylase n=1 Tax=Candidatus Taylorbacteria bacterium RIFOXYD2_FULL_36_9 TaxID=1802338 RepID=A0A1G2PD43_9BACT|nr:MAG: peptide deformylase [Candidatus Taylorbacteria bacterium RIFOXYD2_FULL_36_9]
MKPINILQKEELVLRKNAESVPLKEITSPKIKKIIADMKTALESQTDGVAIAAPQIGVPLRIFVVSKRAEIIIKELKDISEAEMKKMKDLVYINPEIKKLSRTKVQLDEGCLSVRYLYGKVKRAEKVTITAYDENGEKFTRGVSGLLAQIFQHETDHLNGILFTDKAENIVEVLPDNTSKKNE